MSSDYISRAANVESEIASSHHRCSVFNQLGNYRTLRRNDVVSEILSARGQCWRLRGLFPDPGVKTTSCNLARNFRPEVYTGGEGKGTMMQ